MNITGSQNIYAPQAQVFAALLNPEVLQHSIPGCEAAKVVDMPGGQQLKLRLTTPIPGFKGPYVIFLQTEEVAPTSHLVFVTEPSNAMGAIKARCVVNLTAEGNATTLSYDAHAETEGKIAAVPEFTVKPVVKKVLDDFFKNFEKQVSAIAA